MTNQQTAVPEKKNGGKIAQLVISLILFAGFVVLLFVPEAALSENSLFSQLLDLFKGELFGTAMTEYSLYAVTGMYAVLLISTVAAFFCNEKGAAALNFIKTLVAVGVTAFYAYTLIDAGAGLITASDIFYDADTYLALNSTCLSMVLGLVGMLVLSGVAYKGKGGAKIAFAVIAGGFFVFTNPKFEFVNGLSLRALFESERIDFGTGIVNTISSYVFYILAWATLANLALAIILLAFPRSSVLDIVRSAVIFVLAAAGLVFSGVQGSFSDLTGQIGTLGFAGLALVQLAVSVIVACVLHAQKKKKAQEAPFTVGADNQMVFRGLEAPAAEAAAAQAAPAPEAAPVSDAAAQEAQAANRAFEDAAQISIEDIARNAAEEEPQPAQDNYGDAIRDIPAEEKEEEKPFDFEQAKYDGTFNREYADYAEKEEQRRQEAQQPYYGQSYGAGQNGYNNVPPYYAQQPAAPAEGQTYYGNAGFIPDAFFSSLTPAEKDEFDRLFISRIYGENKRLPAYRIGGDNREFFSKIFVFMGRYRNVISAGRQKKFNNKTIPRGGGEKGPPRGNGPAGAFFLFLRRAAPPRGCVFFARVI